MKLKRYEQNPILKPRNNETGPKALFNCAAIYKDGLVYLLPREIKEYDKYTSRIGLTISRDGVNFKEHSIIIKPNKQYNKWGCEDPRVTYGPIEDMFCITYVAHYRLPWSGVAKTILVSTPDFKSFRSHGIITPPGVSDRDVILFPEKIDGKYIMLHRPANWTTKHVYEKNGKLLIRMKETAIKWPLKEVPDYFPEKPSIWIAYSDDLRKWSGHKVLMEPKEGWEWKKIGAGPPPLKTDKGWLILYHGVSEIKNSVFRRYDGKIYKYKYSAGAAILGLNNPSKVIGRTKKPILEPIKDYEIYGDVPNVVFPTGMFVKDGILQVYYGAADKTCCLATCSLNKLIDYLFKGN